MAIGDLIQTVMTVYKADPSDHLKAMAKLEGGSKAFAQAVTAAAKESKKQFADIKASIVAVQAAIPLLEGAFNLTKVALEHTRLEAVKATVDMDALRRASGGLKKDTDLLREAMEMKSAALKLTSAEMEVAQGAMTTLTRRTGDADKASQAVNDALRGEFENLKKLIPELNLAGLAFDKVSDRGKIKAKVLEALALEAGKVATAEELMAETSERTAVRMGNALDMVKEKAGSAINQIVAAYTSGGQSITAISQELQIATDMALAQQAMSLAIWQHSDVGKMTMAMLAGTRRDRKIADEFANIRGSMDAEMNTGENDRALAAKLLAGGSSGGGGSRPKAKPGEYGWGAGAGNAAANEAAGFGDWLEMGNLKERGGIDAFFGEGWKAENKSIDEQAERIKKQLEGLSEAATKDITGSDKGRASFLEKTFGKLDEFNGYAAAFNMLTGAVSAGFGAWIDGSKSAGQAIKEFFAGSMKSLAITLAVEAIKEAAYGFASLATPGGQAKAALHFKSAALHGAGAIAAGAAAKALGGGAGAAGAASGGGAGAAAPIGNAGGGGGGAASHQVIVVGDQFSDDHTPRQRAAAFKKRVRSATGGQGSGDY